MRKRVADLVPDKLKIPKLRDVWRAFLIYPENGVWGVEKGVRDPSLEGVFGGSGPPPKWGSRFGVFLGVKKWSKMVKKGAGRRGKQKCSFRG